MITVGKVLEAVLDTKYPPYNPVQRRQTENGTTIEEEFGSILDVACRKELKKRDGARNVRN